MATPAAADGTPAVRSFVRRIGDRLEVEVPEPKFTLIIGLVLLTCFGASFVIFITGNPPLELFIIGFSICLFFTPSLLCLWNYSFRRTWLVVGPHKWRAVSGWMMSAPDPDRFVKGPFITHQKDGLVEDFISLTVVTENKTRGLLFESTGGSFYFHPLELQSLSRIEKEWLAGKVNNFMNEMKGRKHGQDGSIRLQTIQPWSQHVVDYSTLPENLRPVDSIGGFNTHIRRRGNRIDVFTHISVECTLWPAVTLGICAALIVLTSKESILQNIPLFVLGIPMLISAGSILWNISGTWLVVERYTWRLTRYWLHYPNIERDMSRSQNWSDKELCGAFVDEITTTDNDGMRGNYYYFSLRIQNNTAGADQKVIHVLASTRDEMQWLAEEVDKHIKMVKEHWKVSKQAADHI